jgi:hypothetical protein
VNLLPSSVSQKLHTHQVQLCRLQSLFSQQFPKLFPTCACSFFFLLSRSFSWVTLCPGQCESVQLARQFSDFPCFTQPDLCNPAGQDGLFLHRQKQWRSAGSVYLLLVFLMSHIIFTFQQKHNNIVKEIKAKDLEIRIYRKKKREIHRR